MANAQLVETTHLITSTLLTVAVLLLAVGLLSAIIARKFGGNSRPKRQLVFTLVSAPLFLGIMYFVHLRMSGHI